MKISVIIPAYREEDRINGLLRHLFSLPGAGGVEAIVSDGSPDQSTLKAISRPDVVRVGSPPGRAVQMNRGARAATGEVLLFLHADTFLPGEAFGLVRETMSRPGYVGGAFDLGIDSGRFIYRVIERNSSWRSRLTRIPYGDQALFFRAPYFRALGGYSEIPLMEDVEIMRRIKRQGGRIRILSDRVRTSARRWEEEGVLYCTLRNRAIMLLYLWGMPPAALSRLYR